MPASSHKFTDQTIKQPYNLNLIKSSENLSVYPCAQISSKSSIENF